MKVSSLLSSVAMVSAVAFSGQASALSFNFTPDPTVTALGNLNVAPAVDKKLVDVGGLYLPDYFTFTLTKLSNVNVDFSTLAGVSVGATFSLFTSTGTTSLQSFNMPVLTVLGGPELIFAGLSAGSYKFQYNPGLITANVGTKVTFTAIPVPEPETNALMLVGLGIIGLIARRKFA